MTLREAHLHAANRLAAHPYLREHATSDAATILLHALNLSQAVLHAHPDRPVLPVEADHFEALLARRLNFEPIQYILGEQEFYGLPLHVTPAVLIPRPETELLVEAVLTRLPKGRELCLLDVGTGSGAIAIALAHHLPQAHILAVDLSPEALTVARQNAGRHDLAERITFWWSDLFVAIGEEPLFDAIVSNPPYVPDSDRFTLHPQVRDYEPAQALFAGSDGLDIYRRLIPQAYKALKPGALLALEFGYAQAEAISHLLREWNQVEILEDLNRIPRTALARKPL